MAARRPSGGNDQHEREQGTATPDVVLDVPSLSVEEIAIEVDELHARIALDARLADLIELHVGADVDLGNVALEIKGVQAEAHLRAHLDNVSSIMSRALDTIDQHPEIVVELARHVVAGEEAVGDGAGGGGLERFAESLGRGTKAARS